MNEAIPWISVAALLLSVITFAATQIGLLSAAKVKRVAELENRVRFLEVQLENCEQERDRYMRENLELLRRISRQDNG